MQEIYQNNKNTKYSNIFVAAFLSLCFSRTSKTESNHSMSRQILSRLSTRKLWVSASWSNLPGRSLDFIWSRTLATILTAVCRENLCQIVNDFFNDKMSIYLSMFIYQFNDKWSIQLSIDDKGSIQLSILW